MEIIVKKLIDQAIINIIQNSGSDEKLKELLDKHDVKIHFIPKKYRIFGGILQSMNIQFGNFIEELMTLIIKNDGKYEILEGYSGKKSNSFKLSIDNEKMIDEYITKCQTDNKIDINKNFPTLLKSIIADKTEKYNTFKHDIDLLFKNKKTGKIYYLEIKYNDDHDTGKFVDINRKFIKTYAYISKELKIKKYDDLIPIIFFFTNKKMKGNIYVPEDTNIRRGEFFFKEFLKLKYDDVNKYMTTLSEDKDTIKMFSDLYNKVMNI